MTTLMQKLDKMQIAFIKDHINELLKYDEEVLYEITEEQIKRALTEYLAELEAR